MTNSKRQHGIGSLAPNEKIVGKPGGLVEPGVKQYGFFKKAFKKIKNVGKKVFKSPLGKAALIGGSLYGLGRPESLMGWSKRYVQVVEIKDYRCIYEILSNIVSGGFQICMVRRSSFDQQVCQWNS